MASKFLLLILLGLTPAANASSSVFYARLINDIGVVNEDESDRIHHELRSARLSFKHKWGNGWTFNSAVDINDGFKIRALTVDRKFDNFNVTAGQFRTPSSMEASTSGSRLSFLTRSSITELTGQTRQTGVMISSSNENMLWQAGIYNNALSDDGDHNDKTMSFRYISRKSTEETMLHVGATFRYRHHDNDFTDFKTRPKNRFIDRHLDYDLQTQSDRFYGIEAYYQTGPLFITSEYGYLRPSNRDLMSSISGGHMDIGYVLGGSKLYDYKKGRTKGIKATTKDFDPIEFIVRFDQSKVKLDTHHDKQSSINVITSWWMDDYLRISLDLSNTKTMVGNISKRIRSSVFRVQIEF